MKIEINIPKEFERHFNQDKFENSLERISAGIKHSLENGNYVYGTKYEYETIKMLEEVLKNSKSVYNVDKVIEELNDAKHDVCLYDYDLEYYQRGIDKAIEIVKGVEKMFDYEKDCCDYCLNCAYYWQNTDTENQCEGENEPCHEYIEFKGIGH